MRLFISYAHADEAYKNKLEKFLSGLKRQGAIDWWTDRAIVAGEDWGNEIKQGLLNSNVILFLVSSDFMASDYINDVEIAQAIKRHEAGEVIIVPVIIRPCDFTSLPLQKFQALPKNALPISKWQNEDEAFMDVVNGLKNLINNKNLSSNSPYEPATGLYENIKPEIFDGDHFRNYIAQNKTEIAIKELLNYLSKSKKTFSEQVILQSGKFQELQKNSRMGLWSIDESNRSRTQINAALLEIISEIESA